MINHICNCCFIVTFTKPSVLLGDVYLSTSHTWQQIVIFKKIEPAYCAVITFIGQYPRHRFFHNFKIALLNCWVPPKKHVPQAKVDFPINTPPVTTTSLGDPHIPLSVNFAELYHHIYYKPVAQRQALPTSCQRRENQTKPTKKTHTETILTHHPLQVFQLPKKPLIDHPFQTI